MAFVPLGLQLMMSLVARRVLLARLLWSHCHLVLAVELKADEILGLSIIT